MSPTKQVISDRGKEPKRHRWQNGEKTLGETRLSRGARGPKNLPRSGQPTKTTPRAQRRLIQEVIKEPRTTSKELQASLTLIKASVHDSTIRGWAKTACMGEFQGKSYCWPKYHKCSSHICQNIYFCPKIFGQIFCGLMRQKLNCLEGVCSVTPGIKPTQHFIKKHHTNSQTWLC